MYGGASRKLRKRTAWSLAIATNISYLIVVRRSVIGFDVTRSIYYSSSKYCDIRLRRVCSKSKDGISTEMSQNDEIQKAAKLAAEGKRTQARATLLGLDPHIKDVRTRLTFIDVALTILSPIEDNRKILSLVMEGIKITEASGLSDLKAYFMARAADSSMLPVATRRHRMSMLKLAPRWFEFATEAEKREYESLEVAVKALEKGVDSSLSQAKAIAEESGNKRVQGFVLMAKAAVERARYMQYRSDCMRSHFRAKLWSRFKVMRSPIFEYFLLFKNGDARKLSAFVKAFTQSLLKAAALFEEINDSAAAHAYHNLANDLRTAYRFRSAKRYLAKGREIARRHNDSQMLRQIEEMERIISKKNKDVPDYSHGERRDLDTR